MKAELSHYIRVDAEKITCLCPEDNGLLVTQVSFSKHYFNDRSLAKYVAAVKRMAVKKLISYRFSEVQIAALEEYSHFLTKV